MNDVIRYLSFSAWLMKFFFLFFLSYFIILIVTLFISRPHFTTCEILVPWAGMEPVPPAVARAESAPGQPGRPHEDIFDRHQLWSVTGQCASKHPTVHRIAPHSKELSKCHWCQGWKNLSSKCSYFLSSLVQMHMVRKVSPADTI